MDIVEFLTAQENKREQEAREAGPSWQREPACAADDPGVTVFDDDYSYPLIVNPAWVLADVAAKRAIMTIHASDVYPGYGSRSKRKHCLGCYGYDGKHGGRIVAWPCETVLALVQPYADHPDFDPAWRIEPATT